MKRRRAAQRGFTLLELLITLGITTLGLIGLLSLHLGVARGNDSASRAAEATTIGNQTLESLRAQRIEDMAYTLTSSATSVPPIDVTLSTVAGRGAMTYRRRVLVSLVSAGLWRIRVEVGWTDDGGTANTGAGELDHLFATEIIRTTVEAL